MGTKIYFILIVLFPACGFGQPAAKPDSAEQRIIREDCDDKVFTKVEILPSLKKGIRNFEDTLTVCLKSVNALKNGTQVTYKFLLTASSHIFDLEKETGEVQNEAAVKAILLSHSFMWKTAIQNGRQVCAYVRLEIEISNDKLTVNVKQ
jgi:hypothetical protein